MDTEGELCNFHLLDQKTKHFLLFRRNINFHITTKESKMHIGCYCLFCLTKQNGASRAEAALHTGENITLRVRPLLDAGT